MREIFVEYAKSGAMTKEELATVLKVTTRWVSDRIRAGKIPTIPLVRPYRFDPLQMLTLFCDQPRPERSLTIEKRISRGNPKGGFRKCL